MSKRNIIILLIVITLVGGFLRIFPVRYDSVRMYDIQLVTEAFDLGDGVAKGDFSIFKIPVKYPFFFPYVLLFFYGIFYFFGALIGLFSTASEFINYIFFHLDNFYDFARILTGILGTALIPLVYIVTSKVVALKNKKWARQACLPARQAGLLAAFLMAFNLLHIHISHQERPHILVSFFIFLSFYFFILFWEKKSLIRFLLLGLSIGLAAGSLQNGWIALIFFVLIVLFTKFKCLSSIKFWSGVLMFLIIFVLCYPYLILSFNQSTYSETKRFDITFSGGKHGVKDFSGQGFSKIVDCFLFYDPSLTLLFILFLLIYLGRSVDSGKKGFKLEGKLNHFSKIIVSGISLIVLYVLFFSIYSGTNFRKLIPLSPFLCFFVGILFIEIFYRIRKRFLKKIFIGILILFLLFPVIQALRFNHLMFQKETRNLAKNWIENNIPNSDLIVMEHNHIRFVPLKENIQLELLLEPDEIISRKDKFLLALNDEFYPKQSRSILRFWAFNQGKNDYQFLKEQGAKYFIISKPTIKGISISGLEPEIISRGGEMVKSFSPFINKDSLKYSVFPSEFENPAIDLWVLKRLGPIIEIYRL